MTDTNNGIAPYPFGTYQSWHIFKDGVAICDSNNKLPENVCCAELFDPDWYQLCPKCKNINQMRNK